MSNEDFNARFLAWFSAGTVVGILGFIAATMLTGVAKADDPVARLVIGGLMAVLTTVIGYWFGSSAGSKRAADCLAATRMHLGSAAGAPMREMNGRTRRDRVRALYPFAHENDGGKETVLPLPTTPGGKLGIKIVGTETTVDAPPERAV